MRDSPKIRQRGLTLPELMVSIAVLVIIVSVAMPNFVGYRQRQAVKAAAEEYVSFLAQERMESVKRNEERLVDFTTVAARLPSGASVVGAPSMSDGGTAGRVRIDPKRGILASTSRPGNLTVQVGTYQLRFMVNRVGRPSVCQPAASPGVPGYPVCGA